MTERLYQKDSYLKEFDAEIVKVIEDYVILNQTAFAPKEGGLQFDTGKIITESGSEYHVVEVLSISGKVQHKLSPCPDQTLVGAKVKGIIDWERRYRQMRMHTALHSISNLLYTR